MFGIKEQLGMRIVYLRKNRHWSQEELAFRSSINKNYLSDLENGRRNPSLTIISRIAAALGVSLSELFKGLEDL
ncbi:MAG: helix-turn-helix domain-containing protein [Bacilli bacterium]|jgi:transcriptional regulator with XRE-family HTH domain|nr:helix-turn-helix domain-containing protein [Bacilli bacterium]MCH4201816.1 helix-turn-helix domain-containing protein [Bacilli bacterium]MCH4236092.1 helix-turn-helix domain-containing protein [Bacilli bacterium]